MDRWKEHFADLLNPSDTSSGEEAGPGKSGAGSLISGAEVAEVVKKLGVVFPLFKKVDRRVGHTPQPPW